MEASGLQPDNVPKYVSSELPSRLSNASNKTTETISHVANRVFQEISRIPRCALGVIGFITFPAIVALLPVVIAIGLVALGILFVKNYFNEDEVIEIVTYYNNNEDEVTEITAYNKNLASECKKTFVNETVKKKFKIKLDGETKEKIFHVPEQFRKDGGRQCYFFNCKKFKLEGEDKGLKDDSVEQVAQKLTELGLTDEAIDAFFLLATQVTLAKPLTNGQKLCATLLKRKSHEFMLRQDDEGVNIYIDSNSGIGSEEPAEVHMRIAISGNITEVEDDQNTIHGRYAYEVKIDLSGSPLSSESQRNDSVHYKFEILKEKQLKPT